MKSTGIKNASYRSIRTTVGTVLAEADYSEAKIGVLLGHSWAKAHVTGRHYIRPRVTRLRAMVSTLGQWSQHGPNSVPSQTPSLQFLERE